MEVGKEPGVSGKDNKGKTWINRKEYKEQKEFIDHLYDEEKIYDNTGTGQNLHGRSDLGDQEKPPGTSVTEDEVIESLKRSPEVDITHLEIRLEGSVVHLDGLASDINEVREMENIAMNVPGVTNVVSHLELKNHEDLH